MFGRFVYTLVLTFLFATVAVLGQTPAGKMPPKSNARPTPTPTPVKGEPFDGADVATMARQCVTFDTEAGSVAVELFPENAPESVRNFLNLAAIGAFDTTTFSRVVPGFVIQGGNIWSREGPVSRELGQRARRPLQDEPNKILHERGTLSMARGEEPNSAAASFFILVSSAPHLDGKFAAFGRVTSGMEFVDAINKAPVVDEKPDKPVRIRKASVAVCAAPTSP